MAKKNTRKNFPTDSLTNLIVFLTSSYPLLSSLDTENYKHKKQIKENPPKSKES